MLFSRQDEESRKHLDLSILILSCDSYGSHLGHCVAQSRALQHEDVISCQAVLESGQYAIVPLAFGHWGMVEESSVAAASVETANQMRSSRPSFVVAVHSSRSLLVEPQPPTNSYMLADALWLLIQKLGKLTEVGCNVGTSCNVGLGWHPMITICMLLPRSIHIVVFFFFFFFFCVCVFSFQNCYFQALLQYS